MGPHPPAILFDLDDTILAYSASIEDNWRAVCAEAGRAARIPPDELLRAVLAESSLFWSDPERHRRGRLDLIAARREICARVLERFGRRDPDLALEMSRRRQALHEASMAPFPGAIQALERLQAAGTRLGLVTNGAAAVQEAKVDRFGLRRFFVCVVVEGAFGCGKPDQRVFRHALAALGTGPAGTWMVGDDLAKDLAPAGALGLSTVWVDHAGAGLPAGSPVRPDRTVRAIAELVPG